MAHGAETLAGVLFVATLGAGVFGAAKSHSIPECEYVPSNLLGDALCGLGLDRPQTVEASEGFLTTAPEAPMPLPPTTIMPMVELLPETVPPPVSVADTDPFDITYWPAPDGTQLAILDGKYPLNFQHDPKWEFPTELIPSNPENSSGCMCGDTIWATGKEFLTGEYTRVDEMYHFVESIGGHEGDNCGAVISDRKLVGEALGFTYHYFNNLYEAETFVTNVDPNAFIIIAQNSTPVNGEGFSPYGKHIIGLVWDAEHGAWRALDPNDAHKDQEMLQKETEFQDVQRFWTTDQITDLYDVAAWTNPVGVPTRPWQSA